MADAREPSQAPRWLTDGQLRWAWLAWEPLMMFRRHGGEFETMAANAHWSTDWFKRIHGDDYVRGLADAGFNCVTTHFHKGFGMAAEAEEMRWTRELIETCHRHGIRVLTYVQSMSIMPETFYAEVPEAEQWLQVDENGRPRTYAEQYWRLFPCLSHDGYVAYVDRVVECAVTWAGADGVWLDNTNFSQCQCDACQVKFRDFLAARHPGGDQERFGLPALDGVRIPVEGRTYDPIYQEAIRFRCGSLTRFVERTRANVRRMNPDAVVAANYGTPCPYRYAEILGVDWSGSMRAADIVLAENGNFPRMDGGAMINQVLAYKAGHAGGVVVIPSHWRLAEADIAVTTMPTRPEHVKLDLAEAAAFGRRCAGATWAARATDAGRSTFLERPDILAAVTSFNRFFREHERLYTGATSMARVATYRNFSSLSFAHDDFSACVLGYEQALIQNRVPFDVLFTEDLEGALDLDRLEVLILANVMSMSDEEIALVRRWVDSGRGLVATGNTSLFDENLRQRRDFGLADLFGVSAVDAADKSVQRNGKVIYAPRTLERVEFNHVHYQLRPRLPERHAELIGFIEGVGDAPIPVHVEAPDHLALELCAVDDVVAIHLVNYDNGRAVTNVDVALDSSLLTGDTATCFTVDSGERHVSTLQVGEGGARRMRVPSVETYTVVTLTEAPHPT